MKRRYYTKVTRKGQVTVPADVRREMNISEGDLVSFLVDEGKVQFEPKGSWVASTAGMFKREGMATLSERELKDAAEKAIADDVMERYERSKRSARKR